MGLEDALNQIILKEFEPLDELLEMKLSFIFIILFAPVMPLGLIPTLVARLIEIRTKLTKLFIVRRRRIPEDSRLVHETQKTFTVLAAHVAVVWQTGLNFVSYNSELAS